MKNTLYTVEIVVYAKGAFLLMNYEGSRALLVHTAFYLPLQLWLNNTVVLSTLFHWQVREDQIDVSLKCIYLDIQSSSIGQSSNIVDLSNMTLYPWTVFFFWSTQPGQSMIRVRAESRSRIILWAGKTLGRSPAYTFGCNYSIDLDASHRSNCLLLSQLFVHA